MAKPDNIIQVAEDAHINWINFGPPGSGKSKLLSTAPNLLVLASNKDETIPMRGSGAEVWVVHDYNDLTEAVDYIRHEGIRTYEWVGFDNATLFQDQGMEMIMADLVMKKPHRNKYIPDKAEYMLNQQMMGGLVRSLVQLPINFCMTAHVMQVQDEEGEDLMLPAFQGGTFLFSQKMCGYMNLVTYMRVARRDKKLTRVLYTSNTGKVQAKDRFEVFAPKEFDLTVPKIIEKIGPLGRIRPTRTRKKSTKKTTRK